MSFENLLFDVSDRIARITINRPKALNALNAPTLRDLDTVFSRVAEDGGIGVAILTGAGEKAFVAGADLNELAALDVNGARDLSARGQTLFDKIERLGKPVIAAVNGFALGGGCELALACTFRVASENALMGLPEVKLGIIPGYGGTQRLPRLVGKGIALEMILSGEFANARRALETGLVNHVVPLDQLIPTCEGIAKKILDVGPLAARAAIDSVSRGLETSQHDGEQIEREVFAALFATADAKEGIKAFLEKRKATFSGR
jgi:enoyl-CoA hydratase